MKIVKKFGMQSMKIIINEISVLTELSWSSYQQMLIKELQIKMHFWKFSALLAHTGWKNTIF